LIAFVLSYREKPTLVLKSLSAQTLKPEKVVIVAAHRDACVERFEGLGSIDCLVVRPDHRLTVGERVGVGVGGTVDTHTYPHTPTSRGGVGRTRQDIWRNSRST
jgi:hypothetical protein